MLIFVLQLLKEDVRVRTQRVFCMMGGGLVGPPVDISSG